MALCTEPRVIDYIFKERHKSKKSEMESEAGKKEVTINSA